MSRSEEKEEEEEEEEEFYESLDRILSSSCSSTSASDDDGDHHHRNHRGHCHRRAPTFPANSMYDVWISEPSSVEERRRRLLQRLGLIGDPALSRLRSTSCDESNEKAGGDGDGGGRGPSQPRQDERGRSMSCDGLNRLEDQHPNSSLSSAIARSRSDGSVDPKSPPNGHPPPPPPAHKGHPSPNKPPLGKSSSSGTNTGEEDSDRLDAGIHAECQLSHCDRYCTIKNLDNGEQFVVKEVTEDGTWNKLREVGTGRQLTMEEFQTSVIGHSPIVQELMRRQNVQESSGKRDGQRPNGAGGGGGPTGYGSKPKKRGSWLRSIKNAAGTVVHRERRSSDERDTSSEKGGRRSSSATDDSQDAQSNHGPERIKVRQYGRSWKELTGLYMSQEIQAHNGSIWSIKFSLDGRYLASAGEDCVIHVWQVLESEREVELQVERMSVAAEDGNPNLFALTFGNRSPEPHLLSSTVDVSSSEKKRRAKVPNTRKSFSLDNVVMPENVFALSEKPICTFRGHLDDVLDLSWSKSEYLLSSSMDKTVRLWHMSSNSCLKTFSHSDYVTCIQFNPVDDNYFISGSLDAKVRIWSIPQRQVVDWNDLHEMVTAACYTPDGQGALVGSHKGSCRIYNTSDNKLHQKSQIDLKNKKKKSHHKKITGFQFALGSSSEALITSADSRIRVVDGIELVHKFKGFRNTCSQISASLTSDGKYVISASEDSHVYVWRYDADSRPNRSKGAVTVTQSYEHFHCQGVSVAVPWPGTSMGGLMRGHSNEHYGHDGLFVASTQVPSEASGQERSLLPPYDSIYSSPQHQTFPNGNSNHSGDRVSATWPEEKLLPAPTKGSAQSNGDFRSGMSMQVRSRPAWGMVIVTAGRGGEIKTFQNYGYPVRI